MTSLGPRHDLSADIESLLEAKRLWEARSCEIADVRLLPRGLIAAWQKTRHYFRLSADTASTHVVRKVEFQRAPEDFLAVTDLSGCKEVCTSGTTSTPTRVWYDTAAWYGLYYGFLDQIESRIGTIDLQKPLQTAITLVSTKPNSWSVAVIPRKVPCLFRSVSLEKPLLTINSLIQIPTRLLHGKPSYLLALRREMIAAGLTRGTIQPQLVVLSGETLFEDQRFLISDWFQADTLNAYACAEAGLIAMECGHRNGLHVFSDRVRLQVLADNGLVSQAGTGEAIITNRFNYAMPIIGFAIGDRCTLDNATCPCGFEGPSISRLPGREPENITVNSFSMSSYDFSSIMMEAGIRDYQILVGSAIHVRTTSSVASSVARNIKIILGTYFGCEVRFEQMNHIPRVGSKARRFVLHNELTPAIGAISL